MKIKNIRQYRTFYKENVRDLPNRNEHHMGTFRINESGKKEFGWFEIYHGDKEGYGKAEQGIGNFLQSFLDMAKDGQAVYEFLQNAVDAGASHFTMAWGKDEVDGQNYVMIANNGRMFDFDSIRSILNVGSSTKTPDSQSIGKFGIGFKLAHRLVGKENGLDELLSSSPSGPILFSWGNGEITALANGNNVFEPIEINFESNQDKYCIANRHPWLFKILITCFPALPENDVIEEEVILTDGKKAHVPVFSKTELEALKRWVATYSEILNNQTYKEGSLFFIKLGIGKENDLADKNLAEGVRFSLAILQETADADKKANQVLSKVQLNKGEPIHKPDLQYHFFKITKQNDTEEYLYVRFGVKTINELTNDKKSKFDKEDNIEVLFGFRGYEEIDDYFKGAPNFYLYFPLSEEVHNFNFVLHSNAFYKASSRTFLHKGTQDEAGINERLLRVIAQRLERELADIYARGEHKKFLDFYAALLTSSESQNIERQWVKQPFVDEITTVLKKLIPVRSSMTAEDFNLTKSQPKIKKTNIEVSPEVYGVHSFNWFFWGPEDPDIIKEKAFQKLNPLPFDIFTLLQKDGIHIHVNRWLEADHKRIDIVLGELNIFNQEKARSENFKNNLKSLKLFQFAEDKLMSDNEIAEFQDEGFLILHNKLFSIKGELEKIDIKPSLTNLDDYDFFRLYNPYLNPVGQLRSQAKIIEIISNGKVEKLDDKEKLKVFVSLRDMIDDKKIERLSELRLFKNSFGKCVKIKNLIKSTEKDWLKPYIIDANERSREIDVYLVSEDIHIYATVIKPFWKEIAKNLLDTSITKRKEIFSDLEKYYQSGNDDEDENISSESGTLFFDGEIRKVESPFFHNGLTKIPETNYHDIQFLLNEKVGIQIPDYDFLAAYEYEFLKIKKNPDVLSNDKYEFTKDQILNLMLFLSSVGINPFDSFCIDQHEDTFVLLKGIERNYFAYDNYQLEKYILKYHVSSLIKLVEPLASFSNLVHFQNELLFNLLVEDFTEDRTNELIDIVILSGLNIKIKLFNKLNTIKLDFKDSDLACSKSKLLFITDLMGEEGVELKNIQDKIVIQKENNQINLKEIDVANDRISLNHHNGQIELSRSKLLNLENEKAIPIILSFAELAVEQSLITDRNAKNIFKISTEDISEELIMRFLELLKEQDKKILNTDQLVLAFETGFVGSLNINELKVEVLNNTWVELDGNFILPCNPEEVLWYKKENILSERYKEFSSKIYLKPHEVYSFRAKKQSDDSQFDHNLIYSEFTFQRGVSINVINPNKGILDILNFLFDKWGKTSENFRIKLHDQEWLSLFKFNPRNKILSEDVIILDETLDNSIIQWVSDNKTEKEKFLTYIGINGRNSNIVKFRKWLLSTSESDPNPISLDEISLDLCSNTLVGLADDFFQTDIPFKCPVNSSKHQIIERLISKLLESDKAYKIRLPIWLNEKYITLGNETETKPLYLNELEFLLLTKEVNIQIFNKLIETVKIIYLSESYNNYVEVNYPKLKSTVEYFRSENEIEHNEPYYSSWSNEKSLKLFRADKLIFSFNIKLDEKNIKIGEIENKQVQLIEQDDAKVIIYQRRLSFEIISEELFKQELRNEASIIDELIQKRDKMLSAFYHALTSAGRGDFDSDDTKRILEVLNERSLDEKRKGIITQIKSSAKYSYDWFINYLRYLLTFEELSDTISQKSISFQKIERFFNDGLPSQKYFILRGANSLIPLNIEVFENFSITLIFYSQQRENLVVEGVSKKGQDLLVYVPQGIASNLVANFEQIVNISINFTPVLDLIQKLSLAFSNEQIITPWNDIHDSLPPIHFIYGPPGTGKTTRLVDAFIECFDENYKFKAIILVPTNKAGDVLAKKLIEKNNQITIVRIGGPTDPELEKLDEEIYQISLDENKLDSTNVIITTIHRLPYYQVFVENGTNFKLFDRERAKWDMVVFDESSMISLPYFVFALQSLYSQGKIIIAGDPKQIPAVIDVSDKKLEELEIADESIYKMLNIESFDKSEQHLRPLDSIDNLNTQYRSVDIIGNLFSTISYKSLLKHGRDFTSMPVKALPVKFCQSLKSNISFIDLPIDLSNSIMEPKRLLYSPYHVYAGIVATELISNFDKCNDAGQKFTIGVISPYKAQAMLMNKLLTSSGLSENINVICDTVHGFQGDECDIVIFVINPNNTYYTGHPNSLLSKEYIYNVAISRAKDYLWILCPYKSIGNNIHVNKLVDIADKNKTMIESSEIERYLFGESDFIVRNTYLTGHDNINVFGQVEMNYFIKAGTTAIDIQLKKRI